MSPTPHSAKVTDSLHSLLKSTYPLDCRADENKNDKTIQTPTVSSLVKEEREYDVPVLSTNFICHTDEPSAGKDKRNIFGTYWEKHQASEVYVPTSISHQKFKRTPSPSHHESSMSSSVKQQVTLTLSRKPETNSSCTLSTRSSSSSSVRGQVTFNPQVKLATFRTRYRVHSHEIWYNKEDFDRFKTELLQDAEYECDECESS